MSSSLALPVRHVMHRVKPDVSLHAVVMGAGPAVFLIHGFPQTWHEWTPVMEDLARHHTVVAVDLKGAGGSSKPPLGYDKVTMAAELDALRAALGFDTVQVVGHDIGAMVAYAWAATHRDTVTRLAVFDIALPGTSVWDSVVTDPLAWHFAFHQCRDVPEFLIAGRERGYVEYFLRSRTVNHDAFSEHTIERYAHALAQPGATRSALEWYRAFAQDDADNRRLAEDPLTIPVLALGGSDRWGPKMLDMLGELATDVTGGSIPDCGHWVVEERPDVVLTELEKFLQRGPTS
ncbi:alpha/beta fold hydrolase [Mycolicibacterium goodii]|uniref:alpha/beta fold hydrolase n=1 Tax=Mycolicibacterium goodii TaxID=134601 RepID=UPI000AFB29EA